jgi:pyruvate-ferredoxin/flavodoxin oxidoreductase
MGELADEWSREGAEPVGRVPEVMEMQSEGGAAGAVHGALQAGALATTFTASQGLLLMIPNMYKIAGELTPFCMHVAARTLATHALSIFGDHSDVMACRQTGFAMLCSASVQEAQDFALIAHAATLRSAHAVPALLRRLPHVARGGQDRAAQRRRPARDDRRDAIARTARALTPDRPVLRGTAQNPDVVLPGARGLQPFYDACPGIVQRRRWTVRALTGRPTACSTTSAHPRPSA